MAEIVSSDLGAVFLLYFVEWTGIVGFQNVLRLLTGMTAALDNPPAVNVRVFFWLASWRLLIPR